MCSLRVILFTGYFWMRTRNVTFFGDFLIFILARKWWYFNIFWKALAKRKISTNHSRLKSNHVIVAYICSRHYLYYSIYLCKMLYCYEESRRIKWFFFDFSNPEFCSNDERLMAFYDNADIHKIHRPSVRCSFCTWLCFITFTVILSSFSVYSASFLFYKSTRDNRVIKTIRCLLLANRLFLYDKECNYYYIKFRAPRKKRSLSFSLFEQFYCFIEFFTEKSTRQLMSFDVSRNQ